jgi:hypothetical protein
VARENELLTTATQLLDEAKRLLLAAQSLADVGCDYENEARDLEEIRATLQGWREHFQEEADRQQRPPRHLEERIPPQEP